MAATPDRTTRPKRDGAGSFDTHPEPDPPPLVHGAPMTRIWLCIAGIHHWVTALGPGTYQQACARCGQPRTR